MPRGVPLDLTGNVYGDWTVLGRAPDAMSGGHRRGQGQGQRKKMYLCRCVCGNESAVQSGNLVAGLSKGCVHCAARKALVTRWGPR